MLKACVVCSIPSDQARCPAHRYQRPRGRAYRQQRQRVLARDGYQCRECGTYVGVMHVDHVIPLAKGGPTIERNLQVLCSACNQRKGAT